MKFFVLLIVMIISVLLVSCSSEDTSSTPCTSDNSCLSTEYCNLDNPVANEITGKDEGICEPRQACSDTVPCLDGWECNSSDSLCYKNTVAKNDKDIPPLPDNDGSVNNEAAGDKDAISDGSDVLSDSDTATDGDILKDGDIISDADIDAQADVLADADTLKDEDIQTDADITSDVDTVDIDSADVDTVDAAVTDADAETPDGDTTKIIYYSFNAGAEGWTHAKMDGVGTGWNFDSWQQGQSTSGPGACHEGAGCWATNLTGNYINCQRAELKSPVIDLSAHAAESMKLVFYHYYDFWTGGTGNADGGRVEFSLNGGTTWADPAGITYPGVVDIRPSAGSGYTCTNQTFYMDLKQGYYGILTGWTKVEVPIEASFATAQFMLRFVYASGVSEKTTSQTPSNYTHAGWYIDDISIEPQ